MSWQCAWAAELTTSVQCSFTCWWKLGQGLMSGIVALQVYGGQSSAGQFDAVLTCFFLDTAHNVLVSTVSAARGCTSCFP